MARPRVVLMPASGGRPQALERALTARPRALERELTARARRWADQIAPDAVIQASSGVGEAVTALFADGGGPVLVLWPELAHWRPDHAAGALDDLSDGCQVSVGPMFDGGFYLVAFARPVPGLLELPDDAWQTPDPIGLAVDAARRSGQAIGLLRTERGLRTLADVKALLADPLLDDELRGLLS